MKKQIVLILCLLSMAFYQCGNGDSRSGDAVKKKEVSQGKDLSTSAAEYNDKLVGIQKKVAEKMSTFTNSMRSHQLGELTQQLMDMQDAVTSSVDDIEMMDGFQGDTSLRDAHLALMEFEKDLCYNEFVIMVDNLNLPVEEADDTVIDELEKKLNTRGQELQDNLAKIQKDFAKKYNLRLKPTPPVF